eukprot:PhM_4_TR13564/c0_g1_i2/m.38692
MACNHAFPVRLYGLLLLSVCAMSCGGLWFALLGDVPPFLRASWRLSLTALLQAPAFAYELHKYPTTRAAIVPSLWRLAAAGVFLGCHFASWSYGVTHTSLLHSLLFVSSTPLLIVMWQLLAGITAIGIERLRVQKVIAKFDNNTTPNGRDNRKRPSQEVISLPDGDIDGEVEKGIDARTLREQFPLPSTLEVLGTAVGFMSVVLLMTSSTGVTSTGESKQVSVAGDAMSLLGAAAMWGYLELGSSLRSHLTTFSLAFPMNFVASVTCYVVSILAKEEQVFVWQHGAWVLYAFMAAATSGVLGHTLVNYTQHKLSPLVITVALLFEPGIGSVIGWVFGFQDVPGWMTLICGLLLFGALAMLTIGEHRRRAAAANRDADSDKEVECCAV